jgi:predicted AlkP superfamily phosphohydrolase/phosphomutase
VLLVDAASPDLLEKWTDDGTLPNLKRLRDRGIYGRVGESRHWLAEAMPYMIFSGQSPAETGLHCYAMWQKETMRARPPTKDWLPCQPFWRAFDENGPRAIVLDPPNVYPPEPFNGLEVIGWATNDKLAPFQSYPPELARQIHGKFGSDLLPDEFYGLIRKSQFLHERQMMSDINARFRDLCLDLIQPEKWDLFFASLFTAHSAGHRLWSAASIGETVSEDERRDLNDTIRQVYVSIDQVVGELARAVGEETVFIVLSAHGMDVNNSRTWIFPEMLRRVLGDPPGSPSFLQRLRKTIPIGWRHAIKALLPYRLRRGLTRYWRMERLHWETTRAFPLFSDTQGWVRINLKGREAEGIVPPSEYETLCQQIRAGLGSFVDADTGEAIIQDIFEPRKVYRGRHLEELPDLVVQWAETPAADHRAVSSPEFGTIAWPTPGHNPEGRSGNHRPEGMLLAVGPGIRRGTFPGARLVDLAPTILSLLGEPIPECMEGMPLNLLA